MHQPSLSTPILFIIFNRPETTQLVFNAIRDVRPERLYVAADGPRTGVPTDQLRCAQARQIIDQVDWPCQLQTLFRENNLNCGIGPSSAMSWFFENETEGIVLEDDCLPSKSFFLFCQVLLERYRSDSRVMHIGGNNFLNRTPGDDDFSYYFSRSGHIWGWATWRRAWEMFDYEISLYEKLKLEGYFDDFFLNKLEKIYRLRKFDKTVERKGSVDWWDYQWDFARYINSGLAIVPHKNLVRNLGFGEGATHTKDKNGKNSRMEALELDFPLKHPPYVIRDAGRDSQYFQRFILDTILAKFKL